jgi:hypothetical protein
VYTALETKQSDTEREKESEKEIRIERGKRDKMRRQNYSERKTKGQR